MRLDRSCLALSAVFLLLGCNQKSSAPGPDAVTRANSSELPAQRPPKARATTAQGFDFYLLNLSWSPAFCATHASAPECSRHLGLVLHGLWPQNTNCTYPEHCSSAPGPADPSQFSDIFPDSGLLQHEWATHGTCSGLSPDAYFSLARTAFHAVETPPSLSAGNSSHTLTPAALLQQFSAANPNLPNQSLALTCGNNTFTAVEVCLDKNLHPTSCSSVRSCGARTITVLPQN